MRIGDERESTSVEDRRGGSGIGIGGVGGAGIGTVVIALIASYFLGIDPRVLLGVAENMQGSTQGEARPIDPATDPEAAMVSEVRKVLAKTEDTWEALQRQSRGVVVPDSFTHGSSAQRVRWFRTGFEGGSVRSCDTFAAAAL